MISGFVSLTNEVGERWVALLPAALTEATLAAVVILGIVALLRRRSSHLRYGLLLVALAKFAVPPLVVASWSPFPRLAAAAENDADAEEPIFREASEDSVDEPALITPDWSAFGEPELTNIGDAEDSDHTASAGPFDSDSDSKTLAPGSATRGDTVTPGQTLPSDRAESLPAADVHTRERLTVVGWLLLTQLMGTAVLILIVAVDAVRLRRLIRVAEPADAEYQQALSRVADRLRIRSKPRLLVSERCRVPFAAGLVRPAIVLPRRLLPRLHAAELDAVVGHELLHIRRGDLWVNAFQLLVRAVWWWHPLVWYLHRRLHAVREDCCDDVLLTRGRIDASLYCGALLAVAREAVAARAFRLSLSMASPHPLSRRLRRIMDSRVSRRGRIGFVSAAVPALLAALVLPTVPRAEQAGAADEPENAEVANGPSDDPPDAAPRPLTQVLDAEGRPLADMHLTLGYRQAFVPFWILPHEAWSVTTGDDGRPREVPPQELTVEGPVFNQTLWIYRPGISLSAVPVSSLSPLQLPDRIRFENAESLTLEVRTSDGRPASGTEVQIRSFRGDGEGGAWLPDVVAEAMTVTVDDEGTVRLPKAYGGRIETVELSTPEGAKESVTVFPRDPGESPEWPRRIELAPTGSVVGNVTGVAADDREGLRVMLFVRNGDGQAPPEQRQEISYVRYVDVPVDAEGRFEAPAVPIGELAGRIYRDTRWIGPVPPGYTVVAGEELAVELRPVEHAAVSFPIVDDEDGAPIRGARLLVTASSGIENSAVGNEGEPPTVRVPRGAIHNYGFELPKDYLPFPWRVFQVAVPDNVNEFRAPVIRARRSGLIQGTVRREDGTAADNAEVAVTWRPDPQQTFTEPPRLAVAVNADGTYELRVPKDDPFDVSVMVDAAPVASRQGVSWQTYRDQLLNFTIPEPDARSLDHWIDQIDQLRVGERGEIEQPDIIRLRVKVSDADGRPLESIRVVVWSAGERSIRRTDSQGRVEVAVRSAAWVIAGGADGFDHTGRFVENPSEAVEIVLPRRDEAEPRQFVERPIPEPQRKALQDAVERILRRAVSDGTVPEFFAARIFAESDPEWAMQSAAAIENPEHRAEAQSTLAPRVAEPLKQELFDAAIASARRVEAPAARATALLGIAAQLQQSGDRDRAAELAAEASPLVATDESDQQARLSRMRAAVHLAAIDPEKAKRLWPATGQVEANSETDRLTATMADHMATPDSELAWQLIQQTGPYYRETFVPRVAFKMAAVDLRRAERVAGLMRGPVGRVFARIAIAASLSETAPQDALARLLAEIEELEHLADRGWRSGDDYSLLNVGLTTLPWISRISPERSGDAVWRVLALRDSLLSGAGRRVRLGEQGAGRMRTAAPVTAALLAHFDNDLARLLLMPPDDTVTASESPASNFFLPALTLIDADAASKALRSLAESDSITRREIEVSREVHRMLTTGAEERWNHIQASRLRLGFE